MKTEIEKYITTRKAKNPKRWAKFEDKYRKYALGMLLAEYREQSGLTLSEVAARTKMKKPALSRLENHGEDVRVSTLVRYVEAAKKPLVVRITPRRGKRAGVHIALQHA